MSFSTLQTTGRVTADLQMQESSKGKQYLHFSIAISKGFGDNVKTNFYQCWATDELGNRMIRAGVKKGSVIEIVGDLTFDSYDKKDGSGKDVSANINLYDWQYALIGKPKTSDSLSPNDDSKSSSSETSREYMPKVITHTLDDDEDLLF